MVVCLILIWNMLLGFFAAYQLKFHILCLFFRTSWKCAPPCLVFVSGSLSSSLLSPLSSHLSLSLSRNPIDPNGLISGVCAITHMRTRRNLSHFWRKLISRNKEPSVFPPQWSELILPLELAQTPPSPIFSLLQPICSFNYTVVW